MFHLLYGFVAEAFKKVSTPALLLPPSRDLALTPASPPPPHRPNTRSSSSDTC